MIVFRAKKLNLPDRDAAVSAPRLPPGPLAGAAPGNLHAGRADAGKGRLLIESTVSALAEALRREFALA